jgi:hypothetical protein
MFVSYSHGTTSDRSDAMRDGSASQLYLLLPALRYSFLRFEDDSRSLHLLPRPCCACVAIAAAVVGAAVLLCAALQDLGPWLVHSVLRAIYGTAWVELELDQDAGVGSGDEDEGEDENEEREALLQGEEEDPLLRRRK